MPADIARLLELVEETPPYHQLLARLEKGETAEAIVLDTAKPYLLSTLYRRLKVPILAVTAQPENSKRLYEGLMAWRPSPRIRLFPEPDSLPYQQMATDSSAEVERLGILSALADDSKEPLLVVTSTPALMPKTAPLGDFASASHTVRTGMDIDPLELLERWVAMGYRVEDPVEKPGTMSRRGGIVDIYPPASDLPARLEFYSNTVDSIRLFDPTTQRSRSPVPEIAVGPASEVLTPFIRSRQELAPILNDIDLAHDDTESGKRLRGAVDMMLDRQHPDDMQLYAPLFNREGILSYLPPDALLVIDEMTNLKVAVDDLDTKAEELRVSKLMRDEIPASLPRPYLAWRELEAEMKARQRLELTSWDSGRSTQCHLGFDATMSYAGNLPGFIAKVKQLLKQKRRLIVVSHQAARISELLDEEDIIAPPLTEIKKPPPPGSLTLVQGSLAEGWVMSNDTHLFTDRELFGFVKQHRPAKRRPAPHRRLLAKLAEGDYVVHVEHGIGRFSGVITISDKGAEKEYLVLEYAAGDKLYVPTDQIDRVGRYTSSGEKPPTLSRLGTQEWTRTRRRAKEAAEEVAQELLALYASREVVPGFAYSPDTVWQQELEASFPYMETPDQARVQQEVKEDMEKAKPMDRLVCGDVGYGKTEVAIRAAFKAVLDGKQVAVLVPTTVLAEQHFATFTQRLGAFPVKVAALSRFRTEKEQEDILKGLANGSIDIAIGTHRLLQKDVAFKELGLLIIDEEQRFGVAHKEHLKRMRREVDVLTLSATPIPRTLHMSLAGVRDMSTMETPPEDRLPIKTYVAESSDQIIREAILRELERNGQAFFVHNRVESIALVAGRLQSLVPEARVAVAHGKMPKTELERVMTGFAQGRSDVLACTTIIESGLDMPNVNTLIVNRADRFGLTQLYQLRGRIGRGANTAYAYFLYEKGRRLTETAERRLRTIFQATELGAGFNIALQDLEIRGTGNLLGTRQSGHITAVGFSLYCRLLAEAVEAQKAKRAGAEPKPAPLPPPAIDLPLAAYIPEDYVSDLNTRLGLYQRLAEVDDADAVDDLLNEFGDRFGTPPAEVRNLLYAVRIKALAAKAGIESIATEDGHIVVRLLEGMRLDKDKLAQFKEGVTVGRTRLKLDYKQLSSIWQRVLEEVVGRLVV